MSSLKFKIRASIMFAQLKIRGKWQIYAIWNTKLLTMILLWSRFQLARDVGQLQGLYRWGWECPKKRNSMRKTSAPHWEGTQLFQAIFPEPEKSIALKSFKIVESDWKLSLRSSLLEIPFFQSSPEAFSSQEGQSHQLANISAPELIYPLLILRTSLFHYIFSSLLW